MNDKNNQIPRFGARAQFTPGSWFWYGMELRTRAARPGKPSSRKGWLVTYDNKSTGAHETVANANRALIAASPILFREIEALRYALDQYDQDTYDHRLKRAQAMKRSARVLEYAKGNAELPIEYAATEIEP